MTPVSQWIGSNDPDVLSGKAVFFVGGEEYPINLERFSDFSMISKLLVKQFKLGQQASASAILKATKIEADKYKQG